MNARYALKIVFAAAALSALAFASCSNKSQASGGQSGAGQPGSAATSQGAGSGQGAGSNGGASQNGAPSGAGNSAAGGSGRRSAVVPVQAMTVEVGTLTADRTTAGVISPVTQSLVVAQVAGVVRSVPRRVGDWVKSGETVMQLDDSQLKLTLASSEATLENAKINLSVGKDNSTDSNPKLQYQVQSAQSAYDSAKKYYEAQKALFDLGGISASQLDTAQSQLSTAQANLESAKISLSQNGKADDQTIAQLKLAVTTAQNQVDQARLNLQNSAIRAPFAGQLAAVNLQPGMYASLNTAAFTLVSAERQISFNVAPGDAALLKAGTPILYTYQGSAYPARVSQSPSAPIAGVVPMFATSGSLALSLAYGSVGTVGYSIPLARGALVPLSALQTLENQNYVFVIEKNKVAVRNVTIIAEAGTTAAVDGVNAGDSVVVSPPPGLIKGAQVQPTMVDLKSGSATATSANAAGSASASPAGNGSGQWSGKKRAASGQSTSARSTQAGAQ